VQNKKQEFKDFLCLKSKFEAMTYFSFNICFLAILTSNTKLSQNFHKSPDRGWVTVNFDFLFMYRNSACRFAQLTVRIRCVIFLTATLRPKFNTIRYDRVN